jgi:hypothetical protein
MTPLKSKILKMLGLILNTLFFQILIPYHGKLIFISISDLLIHSLMVMLTSVSLLILSKEKLVPITSLCPNKFGTGI